MLYISSPKVLKRLSLGYDGLARRHLLDTSGAIFRQQASPPAPSTTTCWRRCWRSPLRSIRTCSWLTSSAPTSWLLSRPMARACRSAPSSWRSLAFATIRTSGGSITIWASSITWTSRTMPRPRNAFAAGSRVPNAHPFLSNAGRQMAEHAGEIQTARMLWADDLSNHAGPEYPSQRRGPFARLASG